MMSLRLAMAATVGNAMGKTTQGAVELAEVEAGAVDGQALRAAFDALRRWCPDLTPEQALTQILEQRSILIPDPDGDVRLDHGGCVVVISADGHGATPEELEAAIKAGRLLVDERHVVEAPDLALSAEAMRSLERIAWPLAEPEILTSARDLAGDVDRPNRKQRRKAQRDARRKQRRSR